MHSSFKKTLAVLLAVLLAASAFSLIYISAAAEGTTVKGVYNAKYSKYQVFDVQRSTSGGPPGTQTSPGSYTVSNYQDPIRIIYRNTSTGFTYASSFADNAWCTISYVGLYSEVGYTGRISAWTDTDATDPVIVDVIYHDANGSATAARGFIGALGTDGFLFVDTSRGFAGGQGIYFSARAGFGYDHGSITYDIVPNGRMVCDPEILENLITGSMLGNGETRAEYYGAPEWDWSDDGTAATAVFRSTESDASFTRPASVTRISFTPGVCLTDDRAVFKATVVYEDEEFSDTKNIVYTGTAPGHAWNGGEVAEYASCSAMGKTLYTCTVEGCGAQETRTDIPENPANHVNTVPTAETASSCIAHGYTAGVFCSDCEQYIEGHVEKQLAAHTWDGGRTLRAPNCTEKGLARFTCTVEGCGATEDREIPTDADAHVFRTAEVQPTCTEDGYTLHACTKCGYSYKDAPVSASGHDWNAPVWRWSGSKATAAFVCRNGNHPQTLTASVSAETVLSPTAAESGIKRYTATVVFEGKTYVDTKEESIPAQSKAPCKWCGEYHDSKTVSGFFTGMLHDILYINKTLLRFFTHDIFVK